MFLHFAPRNPRRSGTIPILAEVVQGTITANTTTTHTGPCFPTRSFLSKLMVSCSTVAADSDGTVLLTVYKYDASANAEVAMSGSVDLETLTANEGTAVTITASEADRIFDEGDQFRYKVVNNSAAFNTAPVGVRVDGEFYVLR